MTPELHRYLGEVLIEHRVTGSASRLAHTLVEVLEEDQGTHAAHRAIERCASCHNRAEAVLRATDLWRFLASLELPCPIRTEYE